MDMEKKCSMPVQPIPTVTKIVNLLIQEAKTEQPSKPERLQLRNVDTAAGNITVHLLAQAGYNDVWLVTVAGGEDENDFPRSFVLRIPGSDSLHPYQVRNEVGWLLYLAERCPAVRVPHVHAYSEGLVEGEYAFVAEEYIDGDPLSDNWTSYSEPEKNEVARKIAELVICLGEVRSGSIAGMEPGGLLGPTVEGVKLFKGRNAFHDPACYDIGPYGSISKYVLAYYDKEIYYYAHAPESAFDVDRFKLDSRAQFLQRLQEGKSSIKADVDATEPYEPFVLCHSDLQARNIMMKGTDIAAIIDWEFAGSFPLSELVDAGVEVMEMVDEETEAERLHWCSKIRTRVEHVARERGWEQSDIELLVSEGNSTLL